MKKEVIKKNYEVTVVENKEWWEWDLWYHRGAGFAVYLMAFGKSETEEGALETGREYANKLARNYR